MSNDNKTRILSDINVNDIIANTTQPRKFFDEESLDELAESISELGIIQPIVVRPCEHEGSHYEIIAGERRWRAAKRAGLQIVPCVVMDIDERSRQILALVENIHRSDLSAIEEASALRDILEETEWSQEELASRVGRSQSFVANKLRLLKLEQSVQQLLLEKKLSERQARQLLQIPQEQQAQIALKLIAGEIRGDDVNRLAKKEKNKKETQTMSEQTSDIFFKDLSAWVDENRRRGIPVSWKVSEITQSVLVAEIRVDLQKRMQ